MLDEGPSVARLNEDQAMRHQEVKRPNVIETILLRIRLAWSARPVHPVCDPSHLSEHQRRDIGLQGFERGFDWWRFR
jgi:hypothetical protein